MIIPGEDRNWGGSVLYIDLIPQTCWFTNVRSVLPQAQWRDLAGKIRARAGFACEICGFDKQTLDVHERWVYEEKEGRRIQRLIRLIALCRWCHGATHMGYAEVKGNDEMMRRHMARVNRWTPTRVMEHGDAAFQRWEERSAHLWELDLSMIEGLGYHPKPVPSNEAREAISEEKLTREQELLEHVQSLVDLNTHDHHVLTNLEERPPEVGQFVIFTDEDTTSRAFDMVDEQIADAMNVCQAIKPNAINITVAFRKKYGTEDHSIVCAFTLTRRPELPGLSRTVWLGWFVFTFYDGDQPYFTNDLDGDYVRCHETFLRLGLLIRAYLENPRDPIGGMVMLNDALTVGNVPNAEECRKFAHEASSRGALARYRIALDDVIKKNLKERGITSN